MMSEIKLIALDLDGTLLDSEKRLSAGNEAALKECIRRGIAVVPCTGRIWWGVPDFIREIPGIRYGITMNGAVVEDVKEGKILDERRMSCELALDILALAKEFDTMYDVYAGGSALGEERFLNCLDEYGIPPVIQKIVISTRRVVPDVTEEVRRRNRPVDKINYFFGDLEERERARAALLARGDVIVSSSLENNLEINAPGATKGEALLRLARHLGIRPEQTMGFGDGENDIALLRMAGIGVAMGNACDTAKKAADYVTLTNDEDGVAAAIEKLIFKRLP